LKIIKNKKMKKTKIVLVFIMMFLMLSMSNSIFGQADDKDCAIIYIYRVQESMMSGGRGLEAKINLNGKEIGTLLSGTKLKYKLHSLGSFKLKCAAEYAGSGVGSPYVETIQFEKGKEYHLSISVASLKGVLGQILNEKKVKEFQQQKFSDKLELEEDKLDPIVNLSSNVASQVDDKDAAIIYIYRPQESMMSGGRGLGAKINLNGKEVGTLLSGTKLKYKLHSFGSFKLKCVAEFGGSAVGSPYAETIQFEKGKEYHIKLSVASLKGVLGQILNEKEATEFQQQKFSDELELEEDKSDPIVNLSSSVVSQVDDKDDAIIYIYRPQESMISGGRALEAKINLNGKEVGTLLSGTKLRYKLHSLGSFKLKCVAEYAGSGVGSPYVETIQFEKGKEYHIKLSISYPKGVLGETLSAEKIKEIEQQKFSDELELEEDK
jgi:hypothetical protein